MGFNILLPWFLIWLLGHLASLLFFKKIGFYSRLVLSFGFGFGIVGLIMAILGILYNFQFVNVIFSYFVMVAILLYLNRKDIGKSKIKMPKIKIQKFSTASLLTAGITLVFITSCLLHILYFPDLYMDAPLYAHWAKLLYKTKEIRFVEGGPTISLGPASNYPSAHQVLAVFIYFFTGESVEPLRFTSLLISFLMILLVYEWSKEVFKGKHSPLYSILIFTSLPFIIFFSRTSSHYIYLLFQFSMACYFLQRFLLKKDKKDLYLNGIFCAFVASASYLGLSFLPILFLAFQAERRFYKDIFATLLLLL